MFFISSLLSWLLIQLLLKFIKPTLSKSVISTWGRNQEGSGGECGIVGSSALLQTLTAGSGEGPCGQPGCLCQPVPASLCCELQFWNTWSYIGVLRAGLSSQRAEVHILTLLLTKPWVSVSSSIKWGNAHARVFVCVCACAYIYTHNNMHSTVVTESRCCRFILKSMFLLFY